MRSIAYEDGRCNVVRLCGWFVIRGGKEDGLGFGEGVAAWWGEEEEGDEGAGESTAVMVSCRERLTGEESLGWKISVIRMQGRSGRGHGSSLGVLFHMGVSRKARAKHSLAPADVTVGRCACTGW
jgi:hypothetical protein